MDITLELEYLNNLKEQRSKYVSSSSYDMTRKSIIDDHIIYNQSLIIDELLKILEKS